MGDTRGAEFEDTKNAHGKKVCRLNAAKKTVEIVREEMTTTIAFGEDAGVKITHSRGTPP